MLRSIALAATALCIACPSSRPARPTHAQPDDRELRIRVAHAEARRAAGVAELVQLADTSLLVGMSMPGRVSAPAGFDASGYADGPLPDRWAASTTTRP